MATKAELEAELKALKQELEDARAETEAEADAAAADPDGEAGSKPESGKKDSTVDWALSQLDGTEIDRLLKEFTAELGDLHEQKPLMTLFGAFVLGYVLGRAR